MGREMWSKAVRIQSKLRTGGWEDGRKRYCRLVNGWNGCIGWEGVVPEKM
jgi:hypothetical protein